jgi:hypothetical protein
MITALVALLSVLLGCAVVTVIQLAIIASHLGDMKAHGMTQISHLDYQASLLKGVVRNTQSHLPPEDL